MADEINAQASASKFKPHPEGTLAAVCVDVIDLGKKVDEWQGTTRILPKCALVFMTGKINAETGEHHDVSIEHTVSMGDKANLRRFLESWRGKKYTEDQAQKGVPIHKLVGQSGLITVEHHQSKQGRTYARILSVSPLPEGLLAPTLPEYKRASFWEERKKAYADELAKHIAASRPTDAGDNFDDFPPSDDDSTEMPF